MRFLTTLLYISILVGCNRPLSEEENRQIVDLDENAPLKLEVEESTIDLALRVDDNEAMLREDELFGRFYQDQKGFYINEEPSRAIGGTIPTKAVASTYQDKIVKLTYYLDEEVSSALIRAHGKFHFKSLNQETRELVKNEKILINNEINPSLTSYRIRWTLEDKTILYSYNRNENLIKYVEISNSAVRIENSI